jgi:hypothetical protein
MKRLFLAALICAVATGAFAQSDEGLPTQTGGFGIAKALADAMYCQLAGCTMTGALTASSSGIIFNGSTVKAGGANILNLGNGTNAQELRVFNTDDGAGNNEYGYLSWIVSSNVLQISAAKTGTGTVRPVAISGSLVSLQTTGTTHFQITATGTGSTNLVASSLQGTTGSKALTESAATSFVRVDVASGAHTGGYINYTVDSNDSTDFQSRSGRVAFQIINKGGVEVCVVSGFDGTANPSELKDGSSLAASLGTLTYGWTTDTSPTNGCNFQLNAVSSLTQTTLRINYRVNVVANATATVTGL